MCGRDQLSRLSGRGSTTETSTPANNPLFDEVERDPISERTHEALAKARSSGKKLERPKGSLGVSRLDGKEDNTRRFLELGVSITAIYIGKVQNINPTRNARQPRRQILCFVGRDQEHCWT